jgi:FkbM family methyltransferase
MKIFGRNPARYILGLANLPRFLIACRRSFAVFRDPLAVIGWYLLGRAPRDRQIHLNDGHVILLSDDPLDIVTVFLIFARRDYGDIPAGAVVVDIGANIGVFAVYAALAGARVVYAFEPSAASYECLGANIRVNALENIVVAERRAVVGTPREIVKFPRASSVLNAILPDTADAGSYDLVPTVTLADIGARASAIDVLKLDCEGGEYDIFFGSPPTAVRRTAEIRMECHRGPREDLVRRIVGMGYAIRQSTDEGEGVGYLRLVRTN